MPQTLLLSTSDRNCRQIGQKFQPQGEKSTPYTVTYTLHTFSWPLLSFVVEPLAIGRLSGNPHTTPDHSLIYISTYHWGSIQGTRSFATGRRPWSTTLPFSLFSLCFSILSFYFRGVGWQAERTETSVAEIVNCSVESWRERSIFEEAPVVNPDLSCLLKTEQKEALA